jgi:DNA-binding NarL/FixJ family response regulator
MNELHQRRDTVLVVDDTPENLGFLTDMLDQAGFTVLIATDAVAALELVDQITPDLVLMDAVMPGMDGFEACRRLKQEKGLAHLPVIFMTGLAETQHVVAGLAAGGVDYVVKPIVVDELLARIRVHLGNARLALGTRTALDIAGRFLLALDTQGRLRWSTPRARQLLAPFMAEALPGVMPGAQALRPELAAQLLQLGSGTQRSGSRLPFVLGERSLEFNFVGNSGGEELLFGVSAQAAGDERELLQHALALTAREAEVLLWISRGKANRDIGEILGISPRTVNKHLEQVFVKLGVENRASAAAQAVRALTR